MHEYINTSAVGKENMQTAPNYSKTEICKRRETENYSVSPVTNTDESVIV